MTLFFTGQQGKKARGHKVDLGQVIQAIYNRFKTAGDGADGSVVGFNGSVRANFLAKGFKALRIRNKHLIDFGSGDGRVLLSGIAAGADRATGYELPDNFGHRALFRSVQAKSHLVGKFKAVWKAADIDQLASIQADSCVFSFWVGMPLETQEKILKLCVDYRVCSLLVFKDSKWKHPAWVLDALHEHEDANEDVLQTQTKERRGYLFEPGATWVFVESIKMQMVTSREAHNAWVFNRVPPLPELPNQDSESQDTSQNHLQCLILIIQIVTTRMRELGGT
jgi:hypothetical protein